ncbi:MAG: hypothetical protein GY789_24185 [Hyphomicrobiales bacterium]|nr:hypothetical protein [Hyphomicrobiales bacterium]
MSLTNVVVLVVLNVWATLFSFQFASAQDSVCDPLLEERVAGPWGYRLRGQYCEGLYAEKVSSVALSIVSFMSAIANYDLSNGKPLIVEWTATGVGELRLRAVSLERKTYYRMDSRVPAEAERFLWPLEVLAGVGIERRSLGVLGSIDLVIAGEERRVLLPLRVRQEGIVQDKVEAAQRNFKMLARPGVELNEVYISVVAISDTGEEENYLIDEEPLKYGFYPAERTFPVLMPPLSEPGLYHISIAAELARGGDTVVEAYFYRPDG